MKRPRTALCLGLTACFTAALAAATPLSADLARDAAVPGPAHASSPSQGAGEKDQAPDAAHVEWGYVGQTGPDHWAELSQNYGICSRGQQESPIDLHGAIAAKLGKLELTWRKAPLRVVNTGHSIQVDTPSSGLLRMENKRYALAQFHIHHPSEHLLDGRRFPLELHFVHQGADGVLAVLGVFVAEGKPHPTLQAVLDAAPRQTGETHAVSGATVDLRALLPRNSSHYRYEGSLTTPPCSESVDWVVLRQPIEASAKQIAQFKDIYAMNARPIQTLNRRFLLHSQ